MNSESQGWGGWAWNLASSVLPVDWEGDGLDDQEMPFAGHTMHLGIYLDDATITFKVIVND